MPPSFSEICINLRHLRPTLPADFRPAYTSARSSACDMMGRHASSKKNRFMKSLKNLTGDSLEQMIDYNVVDQNGDEIGTLHSLWSDPSTGAVEFLGVKTGWLFGHNHVVPAEKAELDEANNVVRLPYTESFIKEAPSMSADSEISEAEEQNIYRYYGTARSDTETSDSIEAPLLDPAAPGSSLGMSNVAEAAGSAGLAEAAAGPGGDVAGYRLRRTSRPNATIDVDTDVSTSAASVSPDTTRDQLPSSTTPAATYPTANLYGSTGDSSVPTSVATPSTTGLPEDTSTTGLAGRGLDTAAGTDPGMEETKSGTTR